MSDVYTDLEMLNKIDVIPSTELSGLGMKNGTSDCIDCHYISSDCEAPCFC